MEVSHRFVVVSGIPGCGKSTVGRALAEYLDTPYLDKDEILESMFDGLERSSEETRHRLSRAADQDFESKALSCTGAVLDSFWRHPSADTQSGTPSGWLAAPEIHSVEVLCGCPPELAAARFLRRTSHSGHLDSAWGHASLIAQSQDLMHMLPLGVGALIEVDTAGAVDLKQLAARVKVALEV
ncbi:MAG: hypothetical protein CL908_26730 [Deltaproteobacteria bacterium]|jgi:hypothetical protein|nr:hypothetical protein [Deltaproteobacteria bacterium]